MSGRYPSEERALTRSRVLQEHGTWPGVIRRADGTADLMYDPEAAREDE